jgi:hypothetical protein
MSEDITTLLAEAKKASDLLNKKSDQINDAIEEMERKLQDLNFGLEYWCGCLDERPEIREDERGNTEAFEIRNELGYSKGPCGWGLHVREVRYAPDVDSIHGDTFDLVEVCGVWPLEQVSR